MGVYRVLSGAEAPKFQGVFTLFGVEDGFESLAIFKAPIDAEYPNDLSSSFRKRVGEVTIE